MRSIDEFKRDTRTSEARLRAVAAHLRPIAQEAVRIDALTKVAEWDHFLSYLEAARKAAIRHRDFEFAKLRDPMMVNVDEIAKAKAKITAIESRIATLEEILVLPRLLIEQSEKAEKLIADMTRDAA